MTPYPPFYPGPMREFLTCHTLEGAARQAQIIRQAWQRCGVVAPVEIVTERLREGADGPREIMHSVRVRLIGGLPGRVG